MTTTIITIATQSGYRYDAEIGTCENCSGRITRPVARSGAAAQVPWYHEDTTRATCLLPADTSKVATPR